MYRWQDPPTPAVSAIRYRRATRKLAANGWRFNEYEMPAESPVPSMTVDGVEYVEAPETQYCVGCAFRDLDECRHVDDAADSAFGGTCNERRVIYIRKA